MLYFGFKNYEEFKSLYGLRVTNDGRKVRQNSVVLSYLKDEFKKKRFEGLDRPWTIDTLFDVTINQLMWHKCGHHNVVIKMNGYNINAYSPDYHTDFMFGACEDGDARSIRYVRNDNERVFKMKAGKFMRHLLMNNDKTKDLCEQLIIYVCEHFAELRQSYIGESCSGLTLHVNDKFYKIYDTDYLKGNFNSCMNNRDYHSFYNDSVDAQAAYLEDEDGSIVARCVIFTEVHDEDTGEVLRLAERQYASGEDNVLKHILIEKLIKGGHIDGYKKIGAGCHDSRSFVANDGTSLHDRRFWIGCDLERHTTVSYQDSFKWYDRDDCRADNYGCGSCDLAITDGALENEDQEWDDYHQCWCRETRTVYVWNDCDECYDEMSCDVDRLEDFTYHNWEYYDELAYSEYDDCDYLMDEVVWSDRLETYLYRESSIWDDASGTYVPDSWDEDELNGGYCPDVIRCFVWNDEEYEEMQVSYDYAYDHFTNYDGKWYSVVNDEGIPFHLAEETCEAV